MRKVIFKIILLVAVSFSSSKVKSQGVVFGNDKVTYELGLNFGPSFFLGDLGGNAGIGKNTLKDVNLELTKLNWGVYFSMHPKDWLGFRAGINSTLLEGSDATIRTNGLDELYRKQRNLDFRSRIWEGYVAAELYPTIIADQLFSEEPRENAFRPYLFAGIGVFNFNPQGSLTSAGGAKTWYNLQPLRLEGQGFAEYPNSKPYNRTQMMVPMGFGFKYFASDKLTLALEFLYRKTFTDYLDDVSKTYIDPNDFSKYLSASDAALARRLHDKTIPLVFPARPNAAIGSQRGDGNSDTYFSTLLKVGFTIGDNDPATRQTRCPRFW